MICGYIDLDITGDIDTCKSTTCYFITFVGRAISQKSRFQKFVVLPTTQAELIAVVKACKELIWMKINLRELGCA